MTCRGGDVGAQPLLWPATAAWEWQALCETETAFHTRWTGVQVTSHELSRPFPGGWE